jgi:hypothetical protein
MSRVEYIYYVDGQKRTEYITEDFFIYLDSIQNEIDDVSEILIDISEVLYPGEDIKNIPLDKIKLKLLERLMNEDKM